MEVPTPPEPVRATKCQTCPFRDDSPLGYLKKHLAESAVTHKSRVCHSTGPSNVIHPNGTGIPPYLCRGARDYQIQHMYRIGFLPAPTDEAWNDVLRELGMPTVEIKDP